MIFSIALVNKTRLHRCGVSGKPNLHESRRFITNGVCYRAIIDT